VFGCPSNSMSVTKRKTLHVQLLWAWLLSHISTRVIRQDWGMERYMDATDSVHSLHFLGDPSPCRIYSSVAVSSFNHPPPRQIDCPSSSSSSSPPRHTIDNVGIHSINTFRILLLLAEFEEWKNYCAPFCGYKPPFEDLEYLSTSSCCCCCCCCCCCRHFVLIIVTVIIAITSPLSEEYSSRP
jgi:hypothetical protein